MSTENLDVSQKHVELLRLTSDLVGGLAGLYADDWWVTPSRYRFSGAGGANARSALRTYLRGSDPLDRALAEHDWLASHDDVRRVSDPGTLDLLRHVADAIKEEVTRPFQAEPSYDESVKWRALLALDPTKEVWPALSLWGEVNAVAVETSFEDLADSTRDSYYSAWMNLLRDVAIALTDPDPHDDKEAKARWQELSTRRRTPRPDGIRDTWNRKRKAPETPPATPRPNSDQPRPGAARDIVFDLATPRYTIQLAGDLTAADLNYILAGIRTQYPDFAREPNRGA